METIQNAYDYVASTSLAGITLRQYVLAFLAVFLSVVLRRLFASIGLRILRRLARATATDLDDMLVAAADGPVAAAIMIAGLWGAVVILALPSEPVDVRGFAWVVIRTAIILDVTWLALRVIGALSDYFAKVAGRTGTNLDDQLVPLIRKSLKIFIGVLASVFLIQSWGYSVASLLAGLGIGGLAVALAAKDTVSNLFGSLTILLDRPFVVGDWIETDNAEGVVEEIGFRSTRIRTFAKTQIAIPNSVLANAVVNNWTRMPIRRVKMVVGVTYEASGDQMEQAVEGIKDLLRDHKEVHQDFFLVNFTDFGSSSLDIFVYYFTSTTVWAEYLRVRQEVNIGIMKLLEGLGMEVAFPTRTVYLKGDEDGA
jgi:MscS family membrane protein